jgi:hypothetical protein
VLHDTHSKLHPFVLTALPCLLLGVASFTSCSDAGLPRTAVVGVLGGGQLGRMMALAAVSGRFLGQGLSLDVQRLHRDFAEYVQQWRQQQQWQHQGMQGVQLQWRSCMRMHDDVKEREITTAVQVFSHTTLLRACILHVNTVDRQMECVAL